MIVEEYKNKISNLNNSLQRMIGIKEGLERDVERSHEKEEKKLKELEVVGRAKKLLELFVRSTEINIKEYIEPTITEALSFVFGKLLYFHIVFVSRRNQIEVDFIVLPGEEVEERYQIYLTNVEEYEKELEELLDSYTDLTFLYGGAIGEVLGLVLRLLLVELLQIKGPVLLDEPTSAVHEEYASRVGVFIKSLSEKFNRQIIYVTHSHSLASSANKVYKVTQEDFISKVEEV